MKNMKLFGQCTKDYSYLIFRVLVGFGFLLHGGVKLFGWFGKDTVSLYTIFGLAGIIEFFGGILVIVGLFTSIAAFFSVATMIGAWVIVHGSKGLNPLTNGGELSMLYFAAFLVIMAYGAGKYSLERLIFRKEFLH